MKHRRIRRHSTNEWLAFSYASEVLSVPAESHLEDCASGWGIPIADLEAVEANGAPPDVSTGIPPLPIPLTIEQLAVKRLREWAGSESDLPVTRAVLLDVLRVLRTHA